MTGAGSGKKGPPPEEGMHPFLKTMLEEDGNGIIERGRTKSLIVSFFFYFPTNASS